MSDASARARPDRPPNVTQAAPTPSMLGYAFGERIAPPAGRLGAKLIACSGRAVDSDEFAVTLVHMALWDLERREVITILPGGAAPDTTQPVVRPALRASPDDEFRGSLEQRLFRSARSGREDRTVDDVVGHLYQRPIADPFAFVFELQNEAMLEARLMRRDVEGRVAPAPGVAPQENQLVWLCENVARHLVGFATIETEWARHRAQDPEGWERVHRLIRTAIEARFEPPSDAV